MGMSEAGEIKKYLQEAVEKVKAKALAILEVEAVKSIKKNFQHGGRPEKWKPVKKKPKKYKGTKVLVNSGNLSNVSAVKNEADTSVTLISNPLTKAYARVHQEGALIHHPGRQLKFRRKKYKTGEVRTVFASSKNKRISKVVKGKPYVVKIPARPFMIVPEEDLRKIVRIINK
jgi:phage gpG-like protein